MGKKSAGILLYRINDFLEVLLVHPGGPFFKNKDAGVWSIPKGEFNGEDSLDCAKREFEEETGSKIDGNFIELQPVTQKGGKVVYCWAVEGNIDEQRITSNTFQLEWPPNSGQFKAFPEVDKAAWLTLSAAKEKINPMQFNFIEQLIGKLGVGELQSGMR
jgi:predicted NUDIX family NTP pyrophosphohydrolase